MWMPSNPAGRAMSSVLGSCHGVDAEKRSFSRAGEMSVGSELIADERQRQVEAEGWTVEHDQGHLNGDLALAAAAYALNDEAHWPWDGDGSWNPGSDLRRLVKAGALIAAEIDRLLAACPPPEEEK